MSNDFNGIKVDVKIPEVSGDGVTIPIDEFKKAVRSKSGEPVPLFYSNSRGRGQEIGKATLKMEGDQLKATLDIHSKMPDLFFDDSSTPRAIYHLISQGSVSPNNEIEDLSLYGVNMMGIPAIRRGVVIKGSQGIVLFLETDLDSIIDIEDAEVFGEVGDYTAVVVDVTHKLGSPEILHVVPLGETVVNIKDGTPIRSLSDRTALLTHILASYQDNP